MILGSLTQVTVGDTGDRPRDRVPARSRFKDVTVEIRYSGTNNVYKTKSFSCQHSDTRLYPVSRLNVSQSLGSSGMYAAPSQIGWTHSTKASLLMKASADDISGWLSGKACRGSTQSAVMMMMMMMMMIIEIMVTMMTA
jgi:hypothetical protein